MRKLTDENVKYEVHNILQYIDKLCKQNNIRYYIAFGTLLGAVRHQGFIPWDDDIDLLMFREDYEKFQKVMRTQNCQYKLYDVLNEKDYYMPMPKVIDSKTVSEWPVVRRDFNYGAWVDIFILDNVPDNMEERKSFLKRLDNIQRLYTISLYKYNSKWYNSIIKKLYYLSLSWSILIGPKYFSKKLNRLAQKYNTTNTKDVLVNIHESHNNRIRYAMPRDMFGVPSEVVFEGHKYPAPNQVDEFLKFHYGDYMKLPPIDKQVSNHSIHLYYKDSE